MSAGWSNLSVSNGSLAGDVDGPVSTGEEGPACASCKKRKLRCSREAPTCSHCLRLLTACVYTAKQKPGLKPGAVDALTRRVSFLERILLDDAGNIRSQFSDENQIGRSTFPVDIATAGEVAVQIDHTTPHVEASSHNHQRNDTIRKDSADEAHNKSTSNVLKRKFDHSLMDSWLYETDDIDTAQHLPPHSLLLKVVDFYCGSFHHWIPYIHKQRLQTRVREGFHHPGLTLFLHALVTVSLRHMDPGALFLDDDQIRQQTRLSRLIVETQAMKSVSVESLQALIFLVFDHLNDGHPEKAWPIIGSLTRTIDYLQLTIEPSASSSGALMKPVRLVQPSEDWTELEERRRLFWIIFLLDRFCSVSTGWNTSLTSDDVHRRLPADGGYFTREEPVTTPYFGIWDKAAARIGRSLAHVPTQYNEDDTSVEQPSGSSPNSANSYIDASKLGAFAYCVEATESLSQVTTFFLQQQMNWHDKEHAISWLTRFKELDLRLVHWKLFLPPRWKDSNISLDRTIVDMDPNLTLAHLTHNTSMILLHHPIAHPPSNWNNIVALPKECSAQTCELAAIETSNIVDKFLAHTSIPFVNVQFSFCTFVAAKALLYEHQASQQTLRPEFHRLTKDLWEMSARWSGKIRSPDKPAQGSETNQAGVYARHLECLHEEGQRNSHFRFDFYDHSCTSRRSNEQFSPTQIRTPHQRSGSFTKPPHFPATHARQKSFNSPRCAPNLRRTPSSTAPYTRAMDSSPRHSQHQAQVHSAQYVSPNGIPLSYATPYSSAVSPGPDTVRIPDLSDHQFQASNGMINNVPNVQDQSLLNLSDAFTNSHFLDMDRVITFEDANFLLPGDAFRWQ
ncbi:hypothetical protein P153DRAFT_338612 [Dothidotthia symphoricarpi CBS 119687]|uniref:Zn(2)-C6 fungal-type domain-containing protein n=1 Tax=Dothidotthia symphoricarpi CBS 119687 TaxID=1392245 RepID=A0A6A6AFD5_9PLEO|nr:uncharacterized protein P153DRAFT_338612 [Dothidotthia symphoricarpi CBS 119687]KAF2130619.1 hypothetical protein P153DRAFT_338612 [Dothidotthia symphoricarpi CBS 119687]